jgi:hypothetical protein
MEHRNKMSAKAVLTDIRSGMTEAGLMEKYNLSSLAVQMIYRKLVDEQLLDPEKLYGRTHTDEGLADYGRQRRLARVLPQVSLVVHDLENPENKGRVTDMSETGIGVVGIHAETNEIKTLVIPPNDALPTERFVFKAKCRWTRQQGDDQEHSAGFEIIEVVDGYFLDFVKFMGGLTFAL